MTDAGLVHLVGLSKLQWLLVAKTRITDAGLLHIGRLANLQDLDLSLTAVTDIGLTHLKALSTLQSVTVWRTRVTDAGVRALRRHRQTVEFFLPFLSAAGCIEYWPTSPPWPCGCFRFARCGRRGAARKSVPGRRSEASARAVPTGNSEAHSPLVSVQFADAAVCAGRACSHFLLARCSQALHRLEAGEIRWHRSDETT